MQHSIIQYTVTDEAATENEGLIKEVFAELQAEKPNGIEYVVYKTGVSSFMHMISFDSESANKEFTEMPAFKAFRAALKERLQTQPARTEVRQVGNYQPIKQHMETKEIAQKLADYCRKGDWQGAYSELFAENAVNIEPVASPLSGIETKGLDKLKEKAKGYDAMVIKSYGYTVSEPLVAGNGIAFILTMDNETEGQGRTTMTELCVYEVTDGKIVKEQFYYEH
jgi:quinol monooxygenase YgiN